MKFWLDGEFSDTPYAIHVGDRGFLLGDGLFETMSCLRGIPVFFKEHMARLRRSAETFSIIIRYTDEDIYKTICQLVKMNQLTEAGAAVRVTLSRGAGGRGLDLPDLSVSTPMMMVTSANYQSPSGAPICVGVSRYKRAVDSVCSAHKTLNYMDSILARAEAKQAGYDDALMLNSTGRIACASAANIFVIDADKCVVTPPIEEGALPGIVRGVLLRHALRHGIEMKEAPVEFNLVRAGKDLLLSNSLMGVRPARYVEGEMKHPEIIQKLQSCYENAMKVDLDDR